MEEIYVVVLPDPPNLTTDEELKLVPFTVRVKPASPAILQVEDRLDMVGDVSSTVNELLVPLSVPPDVRVAVIVMPVPAGEMLTL